MKTLVQFGAGNIGRSLVGHIFSRSGWRIVFVDKIPQIVEALNARGAYTVRVKDELPPDTPDVIEVGNVSGLACDDVEGIAEAVAAADLVGTSVGSCNLTDVMERVARGLKRRERPVSILICENLRNASRYTSAELRSHLGDQFDIEGRVGFVETVIGKMVPSMPAEVRQRDPIEIWGESYDKLDVDQSGFIDALPEVQGIVPVQNIKALVDRKLFIHNLGHAVAAYHGFLRGRAHIWECMEDRVILEKTRGAMWESARALVSHYPDVFTAEAQQEHIDDLLRRFHNKALGDTVFRVGRDLRRKLGPEDRCIAAARLCLTEGIDPVNIIDAIGAGLHFKATDENGARFFKDVEIHDELASKGVRGVLAEVSGLDPRADADLIDRIVDAFGRNAD